LINFVSFRAAADWESFLAFLHCFSCCFNFIIN
jgi:hypothetical protein